MDPRIKPGKSQHPTLHREEPDISDGEIRHARYLSWAMVIAIVVYVAAFFAGDSIFDDRIQRPVGGTLLFVVVVWFLVWLLRNNRAAEKSSIARLGVILAWISLLIGAVFGIVIGVMTSALFGVIAAALHGKDLITADRVLLWGVNLGIAGFAIGLTTVNATIKRISTPILGLALLYGIGVYVAKLVQSEGAASEAA